MKMSQEQIHLSAIVPTELAGMRLDQVLATLFPEHSRSRLQHWIREQHIKIDGRTLRPRDKMRGGEVVVIEAELEAQTSWEAQAITLNIVYEDEALLIINKPVGLVVHPAVGHRSGTLVNALLHHAPQFANLPRAGIVHRLDKDTSGLLVIAKTLSAHTKLVKQLQRRRIKREYEAIITGILTGGGTIDAPIGRHPRQRQRMAVTDCGKPAITHYRIKKRYIAHTHIAVQLETGRTHQIRAHMAHIHHPIVGDSTYGGRKLAPHVSDSLREALRQFTRQALHAIRLGLTHPETNEYMEWSVDLPEDMQQLLLKLERG